jgi:hypothetical protein
MFPKYSSILLVLLLLTNGLKQSFAQDFFEKQHQPPYSRKRTQLNPYNNLSLIENSPTSKNAQINSTNRKQRTNEGNYKVRIEIKYQFNTPTDSVPSNKTIEVYDNKNLEEVTEYYFDYNSEQWIPQLKEEWIYNLQGKTTSHLEMRRNPENGTMVNYIMELWEYDQNQNQTKYQKKYWNDELQSWIPNLISEAEYNENGIKLYSEGIGINPRSGLQSKTQITFNNFGDITVWKYYERNSSQELWFLITDHQFLYDDEGKLLKDENFHFSEELNQMIGVDKKIYSYNLSGLLIEQIEYEWDTAAEDWIAVQKKQFQHESSQLEITIEYKSEDGNSWIPLVKFEDHFDEEERRIKGIRYHWNASENIWQFEVKTETSYDEYGYRSYINFNWDQKKQEWIPASKLDHYYDGGVFYGDYEWDSEKELWICRMYMKSIINTYGDYVYIENCEWDNSSQECLPIITESWDREYNADGILIKSESEFWKKGDPEILEKTIKVFNNNGLLQIKSNYNWNNDDWEIEDKTYYYYYDNKVASLASPDENELRVYPNPAFDFLYFDTQNLISKYSIYSTSGDLLYLRNSPINSIDMNSFPPGLYLMKLDLQNGSCITKKIIKE